MLPKNPKKFPKFTDKNVECEEVYFQILKELSRLSDYTKEKANSINIAKVLKQNLVQIFDEWVGYWAFQSSYLHEYKKIYLPPLKDTPKDDLNENGLRIVWESLSGYIIPEISRLFYIAHKSTELKDWSLNCTIKDFWLSDWSGVLNDPNPPEVMDKIREDNDKKKRQEQKNGPPPVVYKNVDKEFEDALKSYSEKPMEQQVFVSFNKTKTHLWFRPVSQYTQRNLYDAVMLLTEKIEDYNYDVEIMTFISHLTLRLGHMFLYGGDKNTFNIPHLRDEVDKNLYRPNRTFMQWAGSYFYELLQRVYYTKHMLLKTDPITKDEEGPLMHLSDEKIAFFKQYLLFLCKDMGNDDFYQIYGESLKESFEFPGDDLYYTYTHRNGYVNRGDLILELRQETQGPLFFLQHQLQIKTIIEKVMRGDTKLSYVFLFNLLDRFFLMEVNINWRNAIVIEQSGIQMSEAKLIDSSIPCIVSIFSNPLLHYKKRFFNTSSIFETLVGWLLFIKHEKHGYLFKKNISLQIRTLLGEDEHNVKRVRSILKNNEGPKDDFDEIPVIFDDQNNVIKKM
jgi:hypothetical protein